MRRQRPDCCKHGHPWAEGSFSWQYGKASVHPYRDCKACNAERARRWRARRKQGMLAQLAAAQLAATIQRLRAP